MKSMTGYGRGEAVSSDGRFTFRVEVSSVNRKQFELKLNLPKEMVCLENGIRLFVASKISRGALSMRVEAASNGTETAALRINMSNALALLRQLLELNQAAGIRQEPQAAELLAVPGVLEQGTLDFCAPENEEKVRKACSDAIDMLIRMRETEGENLRRDLVGKIQFLSNTVDKLEPLTADLPRQLKEKLLQKLKEAQLGIDLNDERVLRELVVYSDRVDVSEEITRLRSHFAHFLSFLNHPDDSLGRNMDFLSQEIFRELNTLGNKAASVEVSPLIVQLKTEIEKVREQIQNIE